MDLTIVTCDYNTPELLSKLVKSIRLVCEEVPKIFVVETGEESYPLNQMIPGVTYNWKPMSSHGDAVNRAFQMVKTKYVLLVDSDVIFLKDFKKPFESFKNSDLTLMGEVVGDRGGKALYPRVNPWYCFINLDNLKKHKIEFYDHYRTKILKSEKIYDIGSSMFEDVVGKGLWVGDAKMENVYFKHYEGMSWRVQKYNPDNIDTDIDLGGTHPNKALYDYGVKIQEIYKQETAYLNDIQ